MMVKLHKSIRRGLPRFFSSKDGKTSLDVDGCRLDGSTEVEEFDVSLSLSVDSCEQPEKDCLGEESPEDCMLDDSEESDIKPMMARLDALQMQQKIQGMNHPDVLFALKSLARAHRRRGEVEQAKLVEEMLHAGQSSQGSCFLSSD